MSRAAVEQVVQTATRVLESRLTAREAVTILATVTGEAVRAARNLRAADPDSANVYRELLEVIGRELRRLASASDEPHQVRALLDDLAKVMRGLE